MRKGLIFILITLATAYLSVISAQKIKQITAEDFKAKIFDYQNKTEWEYSGDTPVLIDFYATWCGPCKMVAPILEDLQEEFEGKLTIYKVNVDKEKELTGIFGVQAMPSFLFIPKSGKPTMAKGAMPEETFRKAFDELFGLK